MPLAEPAPSSPPWCVVCTGSGLLGFAVVWVHCSVKRRSNTWYRVDAAFRIAHCLLSVPPIPPRVVGAAVPLCSRALVPPAHNARRQQTLIDHARNDWGRSIQCGAVPGTVLLTEVWHYTAVKRPTAVCTPAAPPANSHLCVQARKRGASVWPPAAPSEHHAAKHGLVHLLRCLRSVRARRSQAWTSRRHQPGEHARRIVRAALRREASAPNNKVRLGSGAPWLTILSRVCLVIMPRATVGATTSLVA